MCFFCSPSYSRSCASHCGRYQMVVIQFNVLKLCVKDFCMLEQDCWHKLDSLNHRRRLDRSLLKGNCSPYTLLSFIILGNVLRFKGNSPIPVSRKADFVSAFFFFSLRFGCNYNSNSDLLLCFYWGFFNIWNSISRYSHLDTYLGSFPVMKGTISNNWIWYVHRIQIYAYFTCFCQD